MTWTRKSTDWTIAGIAGRQRGVVSRAQLVAAGVTAAEIDRRLASGRLFGIHRGVYAVGHRALPVLALCQAALLAVPGGVLSHLTAGATWGMLPTWPEVPHVTVARRGGQPIAGLALHRVRTAPEQTLRHGLPTTTPARTILDLAETLGIHDLRRTIRQAEYDHLVNHDQLTHLLTSHPGRRGHKRLRQATSGGAAPTRSELEDRFLKLIADAGLPRPEINARVDGARVDFLWPTHRVIVETDGWDAHSGRVAFEEDRDRDQRLLAAGYRVMRVTWRQLTEQPLKVAARLAALLAP